MTSVRYLLATLRPVRRHVVLAAVLGALASGCAVALTATSGWLIARAAQQPPVLTLMVAAVAVRTFGVGRGVFRYTERLVSHDAALRVTATLRPHVFETLVPLAPVGLRQARRGDLLSRLVSDVEAVEAVGVRVVVPVLSAIAVSAGAVVFTAVLLPAAAVTLLLALLAGGIGVPMVVVAADRRASERVGRARGELMTGVVDLVEGAADLVAFGAIDQALASAELADRNLARLERRAAFGLALGTALSAVAAAGALWSAIAIGIPAVRGGALSGVLFVVVVLLAWAAPETVADLPAVGQHLSKARAAAGRLLALADQPPPVREPSAPAPLPARPGTLTLRQVAARYGDGRRVLDGVDLELRQGHRVVITGGSGAGKSTLVAVLLRFLDIEAGSMRVDGHDVTAVASHDVRRVVGCCDQQPHLFDSTIRANLAVGARDVTPDDDALCSVLDRVGLGPWLRQLPAGLDTRVGENATQVSGGQLRRLALARLLLADAPFVLLDEPTEGLDEEAATQLMDDVFTATRDRAVLLVTHRLTGLRDDDELLCLRGGRLQRAMTPSYGGDHGASMEEHRVVEGRAATVPAGLSGVS